MKKIAINLLSIDWDFFFPYDACYDWGHREIPFFMSNTIWNNRALGFLIRDSRLPGTSGQEEVFWNRFRFHPDAVLYIADAHMNIFNLANKIKAYNIINFDFHHDAYSPVSDVIKSMRVTCENWVTALYAFNKHINIVHYYPETTNYDKPKIDIRSEVDNGKKLRLVFDDVFLCRSSAWTPSWLDDKFDKFIEDCPVKNHVALDKMEKREFVIKEVEDAVRIFKQQIQT